MNHPVYTVNRRQGSDWQDRHRENFWVNERERERERVRERERGISEWLVRKIEEISAITKNKVKVEEKEGE
jgi:hypothetical protein